MQYSTESEHPEIATHFAAITPLDQPRVVEALLHRVPERHDAVLSTYGTYIQHRDQVLRGVAQLFDEVALPADFRAAILSPTFGAKSPVRIWLGLAEEELKLLDFFNFVPDWQKLERVSHLITPVPDGQNYVIATHILKGPRFVRGQKMAEHTRFDPQVQSFPLDMEPLMGLERMIHEAADARGAFLNPPPQES